MTKLRQIVKDAWKCDELVYQFERIDVEDGYLNWENCQQDVNEKYSDEYIIGEAENRLDISRSNISWLENWDGTISDDVMYPIHKKEALQLERFLAKHKKVGA